MNTKKHFILLSSFLFQVPDTFSQWVNSLNLNAAVIQDIQAHS